MCLTGKDKRRAGDRAKHRTRANQKRHLLPLATGLEPPPQASEQQIKPITLVRQTTALASICSDDANALAGNSPFPMDPVMEPPPAKRIRLVIQTYEGHTNDPMMHTPLLPTLHNDDDAIDGTPADALVDQFVQISSFQHDILDNPWDCSFMENASMSTSWWTGTDDDRPLEFVIV